MASNYVSREEVEERIQCLICHHGLENPKQLPCTHSYCLVCIRRTFRGNRIACPCCKAVSEIPQDGAECLPDDHYANALIDLIHPTTGRQNTASFYPTLTCSSHRRPRDIYCHTCEQPICYQCLRRHEDHQHDSLADVVDNRKRELQGMFRVTDEPKHRISDNITHLRQLEGRFEQELQATKAEINERARRQSQLIETQRATLIRDLERRCSKQLEEIRQTREEWQTSLRAIDNCEYYANDLLKNSNQVGFVIHEKDIKEKLQRICSVPIPIHRTQSKRYLKFTSNEDSLKKSTSEDLGHCRDCTSFSFPAKYRQKLTFPSGTTRPSLRNPYDVTINHQNNDILVSDNGGCALHRFDQYGAFIASVIPKMSPEEVREFDPKGVLVTRTRKS
ncbi:tripartite motif-containing protein 2-like [Ptychodera flava]|uniref:tripartite motif-containing protein 2-like n=1 Tax=Ptychodera flava TaxID=63121 RepID=UPI003969D50F